MSASDLCSAETSAIFDALGGKLERRHCAELAASGISPDVAKLRGYATIKNSSVLTTGYHFAPYQAQRVPGYVLPSFDVFGKQNGAQFKPNDESSRTTSGKKPKPIKYETPDGARLSLDVPPICQPDLGDPNKAKWITEGIKKVDSLASQGVCAIGLQGVDCWAGTNADGGKTALPDWREVARNSVFLIAFDSDRERKPGVLRAEKELAAYLTAKTGRVLICQIPQPTDGKKKWGIDDYLFAGGSLDELAANTVPASELETVGDAAHSTVARLAELDDLDYEQVRQTEADSLGVRVKALDRCRDAKKREQLEKALALRRPASSSSESEACIYREKPYGLVRVNVSPEGVEREYPLTNFTARITADITRDDGAERTHSFEIALEQGGRAVTVTVPIAQFSGMRWPTEHLGAQAVVYAGQGTADHARAAIQLLSHNPASRTVFMHTGWRKLGDSWVYLHGTGGIGEHGAVAGVEVELPPELASLRLEPPTDPIPALRASLSLLDLAPDRITVPAYGAIWRAILGGADFSIFFYGPTGVFKTELAALIQQHFGGGFDARHLPTNFTSTANTNEALAFLAKDIMMVVDELHPPASGSERESKHRDAARFLRAQGNAAGRGRMRSDGTLRPQRPPRDLTLATGEELPRGQSVHARLFTLEIQVGAIDAEKLTACQADAAAGLYAQATAAFIKHLAAHLDEARAEFERLRRELRGQIRHDHARTSDIRAQLTAAYSIFILFLLETGVVANAEAEQLQKRIGAALEEEANAQGQYAASAEPTGVFIRLLGSATGSGAAHVADCDGGAPKDRERACGWRERTVGFGNNEWSDWQPQGARRLDRRRQPVS